MSIAELPRATISAIGSTSALSDPCSVIKELIDNGLDADATSVSVEISQNAVDVLQVRDNGSGIQPEDRELVCKPSYTTKIQSLEDLRDVNHRYLGFRGLALASIVEMCAGVVVTTKVDGEPVGCRLKYDRTGKILSRELVAHPVGTTVRVSEFLKYLPVRRKAILKASSNMGLKIKKLLQVYAMARPGTRLSLKVLGGKNDSSWIYPGKQGASVMDAIPKIAGSEIASQCVTKVAEVHDPGGTDSFSSLDPAKTNHGTIPRPIRIAATVPGADSDLSKVSRSGQYVSVDGRPLSTEKGVAKSFVKLYKSYIRLISPTGQAEPTIADPFLCLHISLPPGNCDVNVEPAKDDLLFGNNALVLSTLEGLLKDEYGNNLKGSPNEQGLENGEPDESLCEIEILENNQNESRRLTRGPFFNLGNGNTVSRIYTPFASPSTESSRGGTAGHDMPKQTGQSGHTNPGGASGTSRAWNKPNEPPGESDEPLRRGSQLRTPMRGGNTSPLFSAGSQPTRPPKAPVGPFLPSPVESSAGSPIKSARLGTGSFNREGHNREAMEKPAKGRGSNGTLDRWIRGSPLHVSPPQSQRQVAPGGENEDDEQPTGIDLDGRFGSEQTGDVGSNLSPMRSSARHSQTRLASQSTERLRCTSDTNGPSVSEPNHDRIHDSQSSQIPGVEEALEFERRKKQVIQYKRQMLGSAGYAYSPSRDSPRRPLCPPARNGHPDATTQAQRSTPGTPLSHQGYTGAQTKRVPASQLPLERISEGYKTHHLSTTLCYNPAHVKSLTTSLSAFDRYIGAGEVSYVLSQPISSDITAGWKLTLLEMVRRECAGDTNGSDPILATDLNTILERHRSLHEV